MFESICKNQKTNKPLTRYGNKIEAIDGAEYLTKRNFDNQNKTYQAYLCEKCFYWHVKPKSNFPTAFLCGYCTDKQGKQKKLYETYEHAQHIATKRGGNLTIYRCEHQNGYHITSYKKNGINFTSNEYLIKTGEKI